MKIEKIDYELNDGKITFDTDTNFTYSVLKKIEKNTNSLYICEKFSGVRFTIELLEPSPAFFISVADFLDDNKDCTIIFHEGFNLIGAYFKEVK
jgi:hypothetical protein